MFAIDKNVPVPEIYSSETSDEKWHQQGRRIMTYKYGKPKRGETVYPFKDMMVGDSVFFQCEPKGSRSNPAVAARVHGATYGKKFSARKIDGGVRIWRIK